MEWEIILLMMSLPERYGNLIWGYDILRKSNQKWGITYAREDI